MYFIFFVVPLKFKSRNIEWCFTYFPRIAIQYNIILQKKKPTTLEPRQDIKLTKDTVLFAHEAAVCMSKNIVLILRVHCSVQASTDTRDVFY